MTLTSNSTITIDGFTIRAHASAIMLWEKVVAEAIKQGKPGWIRIAGEDGVHGILVTPASKVQVYFANSDFPEDGPRPFSDQSSNGNLAAWVADFMTENGDAWNLVEALGLVEDVAAAREAEAERPS